METHPSLRLPLEKRALLLQVAREEFSNFGFSQASLNRIIAAVGMSKSSFYHYFTNKTDLFHQTIEQSLAPILTMVAEFDLALLSAENYWPLMESLADNMTGEVNHAPDIIHAGRMFYRSWDNPNDLAVTEDLLSAVRDWTANLLMRGQELGVLRADLPASFLIDILMALGTSIDRWMIAHWEDISDAERQEIQTKAFDMFKRILMPDVLPSINALPS